MAGTSNVDSTWEANPHIGVPFVDKGNVSSLASDPKPCDGDTECNLPKVISGVLEALPVLNGYTGKKILHPALAC